MLAACATSSGDSARGSDALGQLIGRETGDEPPVETRLKPGPDATVFIGRDVSLLERLVGAPALVRREGPNEFRRYDLKRCRIYAIVAPAGGDVASLRTGGLNAGGTAPSFSTCTAGL